MYQNIFFSFKRKTNILFEHSISWINKKYFTKEKKIYEHKLCKRNYKKIHHANYLFKFLRTQVYADPVLIKLLIILFCWFNR